MADREKIQSKGTVRDLQADLGRSRILEAAYAHVNSLAESVDPLAISWDMDFTLHVHWDEFTTKPE